ncbi:MAG: hypothetical protein DMG60_22605 [Acidobacteria bacterium]|nr:MAG: hypothetical protein DMG60_22605 [Acidobacteriota bacterium]
MANLAGGELTFAKNYLKGLNLNSWLADRNLENLVTYPTPNVVAIATKGDPQHKSLSHSGCADFPSPEEVCDLACRSRSSCTC